MYEQLLVCYKELEDKEIKNVSETIYLEHLMFCNTSELIDIKIQNRIKEYNFCKTFKCPPYKSLKETPAEVIDDFMEIERIMMEKRRESHDN